jgi:hypothetical protein
MFLVEVAMEKAPGDHAVLEAQLDTLTALLKRARETTNTFSEIAWLQAQIGEVQNQLGVPGESPTSMH